MYPNLRLCATAVAVSALLVACGGGGGSSDPAPPPAPSITKVISVGDSLSDSGTFGYKFTVQGNGADGKPYPVWVERIAAPYGTALCPRYRAASLTAAYVENTACTNYAVGGAQINPLTAAGAPITTPQSIIEQIKSASAAGVSSKDLVLIDGGANDVARLIENFLAAAQGRSDALLAQLASQIPADALRVFAAGGQTGLGQAAGFYLQNLAVLLANTVQNQLLAKGVEQVVMLNVPPVTLTPQFAQVLQMIEAAQGPAQAQALGTAFDTWVKTFNASLQTALGNNSHVAVVDFYSNFTNMTRTPAQYGFTNVTVPACSVIGTNDLYACTDALLSAAAPATTLGADWWKTYMFSNAFHPTPYAHQKMQESAEQAMAAKGWK